MAEGGFERALAITAGEEGGYANVKGDIGGATMKGVTQATYDAYRASIHATARPVAFLDDYERRAIFRTYWDAVGGDKLPPGVDLAAFDASVNAGKQWTRDRLAQQASIENITQARLDLAHRSPAYSKFGQGWERRIHEIEGLSKAAAGQPSTAHASAYEAIRTAMTQGLRHHSSHSTRRHA